jgi:ribosomal-protein-alanine N-acetyltransferase
MGSDLPEFSLAPMSTGDLDDVLEIESVSFSNPWRRQDFDYALDQANGFCRISRIDGIVIGYVVGFFAGTELHLADFAVRPECHRRGYGRAILELLLAELEARGTGLVTLEVRRSNVRAVKLYSGAGFSTVAIRGAYYSRPVEDAIVMLKALAGVLSDWIPSTLSETTGNGESS